MEVMEEQEETVADIFEDCNNRELKQELIEEISLEKQKLLENCNETEANQKPIKSLLKYNKNNNNNNHHHVIPVSIIIVVMTIYLGMTNIHKCLVNCVKENTIKEQTKNSKQEPSIALELAKSQQNSIILERLLDYKDICKDLEIFTKDNNLKTENINGNADKEKPSLKAYEILKHMKDLSDGNAGIKDDNSISTDNNVASGDEASGSGSCMKESRHKNKKSKYSIKSSTNAKNGFNKYNKSSFKATKYYKNNNNKKELNLNKKNSTAEPIIYLFALVFIYLLIKAASDINQHYKSQNKNDKRLRRCSLQSYAQTHRTDRRASKAIELALKPKHHRQQQQNQQRLNILPPISLSQDQQYHPHHHGSQTQPQTSEKQPQQQSQKQQQHHQQPITKPGSPPIRSRMSYSSNWQLLRQHTITQSLDNSDLLTNTVGGISGQEFTSNLMARRCSVPVALSYPRQKISHVSPLASVSDHIVNVSLSRRTSITSSPLNTSLDSTDGFLPETKRRVRMINRH